MLPAHAGMIPLSILLLLLLVSAPRSRGDDPGRVSEVTDCWVCSPLTRG